MKHYITLLRIAITIAIIIILQKFSDTLDYSTIGMTINYVPLLLVLNYFSHQIEIDSIIVNKYIYLAIVISILLALRMPIFYGLILFNNSIYISQLCMTVIVVFYCLPIMYSKHKTI